MSDDNSKAWPFESQRFKEVTEVVKGANLHAQEKVYIPTSHRKDLGEPAPNPYNKAVHSPDHYTRGGIETIDFIEAKGLGFHLGNTVKYVSRAGFKQDAKVQDLEKAMWYLMREINRLDSEYVHTTSKVKK